MEDFGGGADGLSERRAEIAAVGAVWGGVFGGCDVEGGVGDAVAGGGELDAVEVGAFAGATLFDRDSCAVGCCWVNGVERRGDVERDAVFFGKDGYGVGADLVGGVAVGGDAIGADDDSLYAALAHEVAGHVVADERGGDVVLEELPRGEACALVEGSSLVGEDVDRALPASMAARMTPRAEP